jgi:hypothetical protein
LISSVEILEHSNTRMVHIGLKLADNKYYSPRRAIANREYMGDPKDRFTDPEYLAEIALARNTPINQYIPWGNVVDELDMIPLTMRGDNE